MNITERFRITIRTFTLPKVNSTKYYNSKQTLFMDHNVFFPSVVTLFKAQTLLTEQIFLIRFGFV